MKRPRRTHCGGRPAHVRYGKAVRTRPLRSACFGLLFAGILESGMSRNGHRGTLPAEFRAVTPQVGLDGSDTP